MELTYYPVFEDGKLKPSGEKSKKTTNIDRI